jgi:hypothetical protein
MATINDIVNRFIQGVMIYFLIYGKCQSGKTATLIATLKIVFAKMIELLNRARRSKILYIHITQSKSVLAVSQIENRFNDENTGLRNFFDRSNIVSVGQISKGNDKKNMCIVGMLHVATTTKILNFVRKTKNTWGSIVISIDEIDQGQEKGMIKRFDLIKDITEIYKNDAQKPYMMTLVITATVANFSLSFRKMPRHVDDSEYAREFYGNLYRSSIHHIAVPHDENYLDPEDMIFHECFRVIDYETELSGEKKIDIAFEKLSDLDVKYKQYALINISRQIITHEEYAEKSFECGFNIAIIVNSQETTGYRMMYLSTDGTKKSFLIKTKMLKKKADNGQMKMIAVPDIEGDVEMRQTGINSSIDINLIDIVNVLAKKGNIAKRLIISQMAEFPADLPRQRNIALVGCECFDRGNTLQDPSTGLVFTSVIHLDTLKGKDTTHGAKNYQKCGRVNGNIKQVYERLGFQMEYITETKIMKVIMTGSKVIDNLNAIERDETRILNVVSQRTYDALVERSEVKLVDYMKLYNAEMLSVVSENESVNIPSTSANIPTIPEEDDPIVDEKYEKVVVDINEAFIQKIKRHFNNKGTVVSNILTCLLSKNQPINIDELYKQMIEDYGYNNEKSSIINNLRNGSGKTGVYSGYWNVSESQNHSYVFIPKIIKNILRI